MSTDATRAITTANASANLEIAFTGAVNAAADSDIAFTGAVNGSARSKARLTSDRSTYIGCVAPTYFIGPHVSRRDVRRQRDTIGQTWDAALAALRRGARSAADDGAPGLYTALFGWSASSTRKNGKATPATAPATAG